MAATHRPSDKTPRTERGRITLRKLLDAAATEFADKGFHEASISGITRSAGVALGTFYTYFDSKDAVFRALVSAEHKEIYRIIDEAEFVDPDSYRTHYETIGARIEERLRQGGESGEFVPGLGTPEAWALMGMNVFLGLRYVIWGREGDPDFAEIARRANILLTQGIGR